ncbi:MAG TPA: ectonucleotide pyrophosphatase/phosphodiesterase [Puia sp.]|jgi:predicted AlkP superfamily pyrophosphatase or phosphodiesterase|nr:ectonucleotide pyrophosphatase/phosphodiesterase [Puia sp.]
MRKIFLLSFLILSGILHAQDSSQHIVPDRSNRVDQIKKPYIILISADGFRYDLADKFQAKNLIRLRSSGVTADYMESSFPSLTFPNHYSIATGDYPAHDGIVDNTFFDPSRNQIYTMGNRKEVEDSSWYDATPIWVLAEKQKMLTASFYWVGAEAAIQGIRPTYYYKFNSLIPMEDRIRFVRNWLQLPEEKRPHLITFYIPDVDHEEHLHGVDSKQTEDAVHYVDESIAQLVKTVDSLNLPVNYIFLSDHGMTDIDTLNTLTLPESVDTSRFVITNSQALVHMYAKNSADIIPAYNELKLAAKDYEVYLATNLPGRWHYSKKDDRYNRIGDIILVSNPPKVFNLNGRHLNPATHGFDPALPVMHATFYAWGPAFKSDLKIKGFENVNVYPLMTKILQLKITEPVDGYIKVLQPILKTN